MALVEKAGLGARLMEWISKRRNPADQVNGIARPDNMQVEGMSREQLLDAQSKLTRQIEILAAGPANRRDATPQTAVLLAELQAAMAEVDAELATLESGASLSEETEPPDSTAEVDEADLPEIEELGEPSILSGFTPTMLDVVEEPRGVFWITYILHCTTCIGGDMFSIIFYPKVAPDPSPYDGVEPGDTVKLAPYDVRCVECRVETTLFDPKTAGYDGVLTGGPGDVIDDMEPTDETGAATLYVALCYRTPIGELKSIASQANVAPADLFEAILVRGVAPNGSPIFEQQHDCSRRQT